MKLSATLLAAFAAVAQIGAVSARSWEWCANDYTCDHGSAFQGAMACSEQDDCFNKAAPTFGNTDPYSNTFCGYSVYPRSCWVYTENSDSCGIHGWILGFPGQSDAQLPARFGKEKDAWGR